MESEQQQDSSSNRAPTSLMSLMAIQLLPPSTKSSKSRGAKGRKSFGLRQPSSHTTLTIAAVTLGSSSGSISRSLILGHAARRASGYTKARRYSVTSVFLRIFEWLWLNRGSRSCRVDRANEGVMTWGRVAMGRDITVGVVVPRS